jgi:hypothetical protein
MHRMCRGLFPPRLITLKMPQDILDRISRTIDTSIETRMVKLSETTLVNSKIISLLEAQLSSIETIKQSVQEI